MLKEFKSYAMASGVTEAKNVADIIITDVTEILEKEI